MNNYFNQYYKIYKSKMFLILAGICGVLTSIFGFASLSIMINDDDKDVERSRSNNDDKMDELNQKLMTLLDKIDKLEKK
jgi:hypothetical protein